MTHTYIEGNLSGIERVRGFDIRRVNVDGTEWFVAADIVLATMPNEKLVEQLKAYDSPVQWRDQKLIPRNALAEVGTTNAKAADLCDELEKRAQAAVVYAHTRRAA